MTVWNIFLIFPRKWNNLWHSLHIVGVAKVLCILHHQGVQLILVYSWAGPAILVAGKGRREWFYFFCFFPFIPVPLSSLPLSSIFSTISSISFLPLSGRQHKMTHKGWCVIKPKHNQSILANCLLRRQFCKKCQSLFSGKNKKTIHNMSSAEFAQAVVIVNS